MTKGLICVMVSCLGLCSAQDHGTPSPATAAALEKLKSDDPARRREAEHTLVIEGHSETIAKVTADLLADVEGSGASPLEYYPMMNIAVLPHVIPALPQASFAVPPVKSDRILSSVAVRMALIVTRTIDKEKAFPEATRKWASRIELEILSFPRKELQARSTKQFGEIQSWWEHNKEAVMAGRPADATWLPEHAAGDESPQPVPEPRAPLPPQTVQHGEHHPARSAVQQEAAPAEQRSGAVFWLSGILAAVAGGLVVWRMKGSRK